MWLSSFTWGFPIYGWSKSFISGQHGLSWSQQHPNPVLRTSSCSRHSACKAAPPRLFQAPPSQQAFKPYHVPIESKAIQNFPAVCKHVCSVTDNTLKSRCLKWKCVAHLLRSTACILSNTSGEQSGGKQAWNDTFKTLQSRLTVARPSTTFLRVCCGNR